MSFNRTIAALAPMAVLTGCGSATWQVTTWGEAYIEDGIPASAFDDGCSATFDTFTVQITEAALLDGDGAVVGEAPGGSFALTEPGPQDVGSASVPARFYDTARFRIAPEGGASIHAVGSVTCGADTVAFDWSFTTDTTYVCAPEGLTLASGGTSTTELTVHGDHFFYDGLENADAAVRGQAIVDADADVDGTVTLAELAAVDVAPLGYAVGQYSDVTDLAAFVTHLTRTLGHVDGEGHCQVDL